MKRYGGPFVPLVARGALALLLLGTVGDRVKAAVQTEVTDATRLDADAVAALLDRMRISDVLEMRAESLRLEPGAVSTARKLLWAKYTGEQRNDTKRKREHENCELRFGDATMRYAYRIVGDKPGKGYPLYISLHGGGGGPAGMNDAQWRQMQVYYLSCVKNGVYVAPRGVTNTWNLHFVGASYPLYDRLIENMVLFAGVDPNRVYLLGYSAGGDGVYQIVPRMADRFAAASMSAGHHNGVSARSLYNVPFLVQVGERDGAYKRNHATVDYAEGLRKLHALHPGGYVYDVFVHAGRAHNFLDNDSQERKQLVITNPFDWKAGEPAQVGATNTSAIAWLSGHERRFRPAKVVWDLKTRAKTRVGDQSGGARLWPTAGRFGQFYWLAVGLSEHGDLGCDEIVAEYDRASNTITIESCGNFLGVLVDSVMLDLTQPVNVRVGNVARSVTLYPSLKTMAQTLVDRGDPFLVFESVIVINKTADGWGVQPE